MRKTVVIMTTIALVLLLTSLILSLFASTDSVALTLLTLLTGATGILLAFLALILLRVDWLPRRTAWLAQQQASSPAPETLSRKQFGPLTFSISRDQGRQALASAQLTAPSYQPGRLMRTIEELVQRATKGSDVSLISLLALTQSDRTNTSSAPSIPDHQDPGEMSPAYRRG